MIDLTNTPIHRTQNYRARQAANALSASRTVAPALVSSGGLLDLSEGNQDPMTKKPEVE